MPRAPNLDDLIASVESDVAKFRKMLADLPGVIASAEEQLRLMKQARALQVGTKEVLHARKHSGTVNDMTNDHALAISKTQRGKDRKFRAAMHEAGFTQNSLAAKLDISSASLTRYRDKRPVPKAIADNVKELTGFDGSWPGGVVE